MAKQTTVTVTDDLDGSANAMEVTFSLNGESWTIDLSAKNRNALEKALKPYIAKATKQGRRRPVSASRRSPSVDPAKTWPRCGSGPRATVTRSATGAGSVPPCSRHTTPRTSPP